MGSPTYLSDLFSLKGKTAFITGASSGLGLQMARTFAKAGADLILLGRRKEKLEKIKEDLEVYGSKVSLSVTDLLDLDSIKKAIPEIRSKNPQIDILVNNAGIVIREKTFKRPINNLDQDWDVQVNLNARAVYFMTKLIADHMQEKGILGSIINIASVRGELCPGANTAIYSASKAAVIQLSRALTLEYSQFGIRINVISPGSFCTEINKEFFTAEILKKFSSLVPLGRPAQPEEIEGLALLLASNNASPYITGSIFTIDGGMSLGAGILS